MNKHPIGKEYIEALARGACLNGNDGISTTSNGARIESALRG